MNALWPRVALVALLCVTLAGAAVERKLGARCTPVRRSSWGVWCQTESKCVGPENMQDNRCVPGQTTPAPRVVCCSQQGPAPPDTTPLPETTTRKSKWSFTRRKPNTPVTKTTTTTTTKMATTATTTTTTKMATTATTTTTTRSPTTKKRRIAQLQLIPEERALEIAKKKCVEYGDYVWRNGPGETMVIGATLPREQYCSMSGQPLIAGGEEANSGEFPHMVALGYELPDADEGVVAWRCGGSLISERFVLTAAHCLFDPRTGKVKWVLLGGSGELIDQTAQRIAVAKTVKHPNYNSRSKYDDIALLRLAQAPELSPEVRPACIGIEPAQSVKPGEFGTAFDVTGWGLNITGGDGSKNLMKVDLYQVAVERCDLVYRFLTGKRSLMDGIRRSSMLCIGNKVPGKDSCQGDSGGPAQTRLNGTDTYCMYNVAGVTSFGESSCGGELLTASVYTRVRHYLPWIVPIVWPEETV